MRLKGSLPQDARSPAMAAGYDRGVDTTINKQLSALFASIQTPGRSGKDDEGESKLFASNERVDLNPLSYLLPKQKTKYLDITEFVRAMGQELTQEDVLGESQGGQIVFKTGRKKVHLEQVSPMQWTAASLRIMVEILRTGQLKDHSILDYISYMVKVSELADTYTWVSILHYDRAYIIMQAQNGFRWSSDSPHLDALHLRSRSHQVSGFNIKGRPNAYPKQHPGSGAPRTKANSPQNQVCRLFQRNACPFGINCRFHHVCSAPNCGQNHPLASHGRQNSTHTKNL
jgi:hypothetical protein